MSSRTSHRRRYRKREEQRESPFFEDWALAENEDYDDEDWPDDDDEALSDDDKDLDIPSLRRR